MSPHGIAGPQNQSSPNSRKKSQLARHITMRSDKKCPIENLSSPKKWAKIHQNRLRPAIPLKPPIMPNFIEIDETTLEKSVANFLHPSIFWLPGGGIPLVTGLGGGVHQPPSSYLQNFVPFRRHLSEISAAKLHRFCCRRDSHTVNDMSPHYVRRQLLTFTVLQLRSLLRV